MERANTTATVLGITGGYGRAMAEELDRRGVTLRALVRDRARAQATLGALAGRVTLVEGDVLDRSALRDAVADSDLVVHGVNAPYQRWDPLVCDMARAVANAAAEAKATILFPGNVYQYAPGVGISEETPASPPTKKGRIRVEAERILAEACTRGARLIVLRGGDFFGMAHASSWMGQVLGKVGRGGAIVLPARGGVRHQWAYLPDFARAHVDVWERRSDLEAATSFHFEGHVATSERLTAAVRAALGDAGRRATGLPWWLLAVASPFSPLVREIRAMRYLWDEEVVMSGDRLRRTLGEVQSTDLVEALRCELRAMGVAASDGEYGTTGGARVVRAEAARG